MPAQNMADGAVIKAASEQQGMQQTFTCRSVLKPEKFNNNLICMYTYAQHA